MNHTAVYNITHINLGGRCFWLQPGRLLMDVRCHFARVTVDLWAWHCVWVTNPSESVDRRDREQIWGRRHSATRQWRGPGSCARIMGLILNQICHSLQPARFKKNHFATLFHAVWYCLERVNHSHRSFTLILSSPVDIQISINAKMMRFCRQPKVISSWF